MGEKDLDALLERMKDIAESVNGFTSETVQQAAFAALMSAFGLAGHASVAGAIRSEAGVGTDEQKQDAATMVVAQLDTKEGKRLSKRKSTGARDFKFIKDLDLRPDNKQSFEEFVAEKLPASNEDKFVVALYYLLEIVGLSAVSTDHIGSVFRLMPNWREPADIVTSISVASSRKGTIDTSDYTSLKLTPHGRNFVEHDLPPKKKQKK